MKQKIINWINTFLGTKQRIDKLELELSFTRSDNQILKQQNHLIRQQVDLFKEIINVGVDVHQHHGRSWAVVCIQGKADYIAFVDLDPNEIRTIQMFLRNFEQRNTTIDHPRFSKDIFFKL